MNKEELIDFLRNNLKIEIEDESDDWRNNSSAVIIRLKLCNETISIDSFYK